MPSFVVPSMATAKYDLATSVRPASKPGAPCAHAAGRWDTGVRGEEAVNESLGNTGNLIRWEKETIELACHNEFMAA